MSVTLEKISEQLDRVESALIGDEKYGSIGLVSRVNELEEKSISKGAAIKWGLAGLASFMAIVAAIIKGIS